jgi:tRNA pseudouridine13 synthase
MSTARWLPPAEERALGLEFYATELPGLGGRLKQATTDFQVQELSAYPLPDPQGAVTVLRVKSEGWEQHELTDRLAESLRVPAQAIRWAGTKDRRAVAERILSYRGPPPGGTTISIPRVEVLEAYRAREELVLGHHYGNRFDIRLREPDGPSDDLLARAEAIRAELAAVSGFPNFFGVQRFGEVRPITHSVGRALVRGEVTRALEVYLCDIPPGGDPQGVTARQSYAEHGDPARALREFPASLRFERQLLDRLARGQSPEQALKALRRPLRVLFVHAYQAHLFNRYLSRRKSANLSLLQPEPGDWLLRLARDGTIPGRDPIPVSADNLSETRTLVERGGARLVGPLVGYGTPRLAGPAGQILESILEEDGVTRDQFRLPATPDLASAGNWRPLWSPPPLVTIGTERDYALRFTFNLPRGTYATVLLREFMKVGAERIPAAEN